MQNRKKVGVIHELPPTKNQVVSTIFLVQYCVSPNLCKLNIQSLQPTDIL
jgi:hypothetical protein